MRLNQCLKFFLVDASMKMDRFLKTVSLFMSNCTCCQNLGFLCGAHFVTMSCYLNCSSVSIDRDDSAKR